MRETERQRYRDRDGKRRKRSAIEAGWGEQREGGKQTENIGGGKGALVME